MKKLLVVIDMQWDFVFGVLGSKEAQKALPFVKEEIAKAKAQGTEVVFTRDTHQTNYLSTQEGKYLPVEHCIVGTDGWQIVDGLQTCERVFDKPTFGSEELADFVKAQGFEEVTLVGVCTDICVVSNALLIKAKCPESKVCVVEKACAGVSTQTHDASIATMRSCQVQIL